MSFLPIVIIGGLSYIISAKTLKEKLDSEMRNEIQLISKNIENNLDKISKHLDILFSNKTIMKILDTVDFTKNNSELFSSFSELDKIFNSYFYYDPYLTSAIIFDIEGGNYLYKSNLNFPISNLREQQWFYETEKLNGAIYCIGMENIITSSKSRQWVFSVARMIRNNNEASNSRLLEPLGIIYMSFSEELFYDSYASLLNNKEDREIIVIDEWGNIISSKNKKSIRKNFYTLYGISNNIFKDEGVVSMKVHGENALVAYYTIPKWEWKIVEIVPYSYVVERIKWISIITLYASILCIIGLFILSFYISRKIANPLLELNEAMKKVAEGDLTVSIPICFNDEIGQIQKGFNIMMEDINKFFRNAINAEKEKKKQELKALQYQINPHFLYNTLNSMRLMAKLCKADNIASMLEPLIRLLRNVMGKVGSLISVEEEIRNIKDYICIHKIRYGNKVSVEYNIDHNIRDLMIPNFILQPIVENAILHGIEPKGGVGTIRIDGQHVDNFLVFKIQDDGIGMSDDELKRVLSIDNNNKNLMKMGLRNIQERIMLEFNDSSEKYGIFIESQVNEGTIVTLKLPVIKEGGIVC
jgi:two-component system sensor histidine kinase YesM